MLQKKALNFLIILEIAALIIVIVYAVFFSDNESADLGESTTEVSQETSVDEESDDDSDTESDDSEDTEETVTAESFSDEVQSKIDDMTIEEKVAQLFIVSPEALTGVDEVEVAGSVSTSAYDDYPVGGIVYSTDNMTGITQATDLIEGFAEIAEDRIDLTLFSVIAEEGGDETPVADLNVYSVQSSVIELAEYGDADLATEAAYNIAEGISSVGLNMNLSPIVDLSSDIADVSTVADIVSAEITSYQENGIFAVMKYFPGESDTVSTTLDDLQDNEYVVFQSGIDAGANAVMLSNTTLEALTGDETTPCSLSEEVVSTLRDDLGFTGVIITDSLSDEAITDSYTSEEAAVQAIEAGVDMIYDPEDFNSAYQAIIDAVESGEIDETIIDNAVGHVLTLKIS